MYVLYCSLVSLLHLLLICIHLLHVSHAKLLSMSLTVVLHMPHKSSLGGGGAGGREGVVFLFL